MIDKDYLKIENPVWFYFRKDQIPLPLWMEDDPKWKFHYYEKDKVEGFRIYYSTIKSFESHFGSISIKIKNFHNSFSLSELFKSPEECKKDLEESINYNISNLEEKVLNFKEKLSKINDIIEIDIPILELTTTENNKLHR